MIRDIEPRDILMAAKMLVAIVSIALILLGAAAGLLVAGLAGWLQ